MKMKRIHSAGIPFLTVLLLLQIVLPVSGQVSEGPGSLSFHRMDRADGLPHNTVFHVMQDSRGYIWFGTRGGIVLYDGVSLTVFKNTPFDSDSLSHSDAGGIIEDRTGRFWIRTWGGGLNLLDPVTRKFSVFRHDPEDPGSLSADRVQSLLADSEGLIWAGTFNGGLNRYDSGTGTFERFLHDPEDENSLSHNRVWSLADGDGGTVWAATEKGLDLVNPEENRIRRYVLPPGGGNPRIRTLLKDREGRLWLGTETGLAQFDKRNDRIIFYNPPGGGRDPLAGISINALLEDREGILWIGTNGQGLYRLNRQTGRLRNYRHSPMVEDSLSHDDVRSLFQDRSGVIWAGTRGGGVCRFDPAAPVFRDWKSDPEVPGTLSSNTVHAVLKEPDGTLWAGTWYGGLNRLDPGTGQFRLYDRFKDINALYRDRSGRVWIGIWGDGLALYDRRNDSFRVFSDGTPGSFLMPDNVVTALLEDRQGDLWVGTRNGGLLQFLPETEEFRLFPAFRGDKAEALRNLTITALYEASSGIIWAGTDGGLYGLNRTDGTIAVYRHDPDDPGSLSNNRVTSIAEDAEHNLYAGTYGGGLNRLGTEGFLHLTEAQGLSDNIITGLFTDREGFLWMSTGNGLSRLDPETGTIRRYETENAFLENSLYYDRIRNEVYFGGSGGLTSLVLDSVRENRTPPQMVITGFSIFNEPVSFFPDLSGESDRKRHISYTDRLSIHYQDKMFTVHFAALHYSNPGKNQYSYRLEGFDEDWIPAGPSRSATYTNLPPGKYTFRVTGSNSDGFPAVAPAALEIRILPPFWMTWYFRLFMVTLLSGAVFFAYLFRVRRMVRQTKKLEIMVADRTREVERQKTEMERLAHTDSLTKLLNRRAIQALMEQDSCRCRRDGNPFVVALADIDNFKTFNDTYGHDCGDHVLKSIADTMRDSIREQDYIGRWGGEEFILIFPETGADGGRQVLEKLRRRVAEQPFFWQETELFVTVTIGYCVFTRESVVDACITAADDALYQGKQSRKNCVVFSPERKAPSKE